MAKHGIRANRRKAEPKATIQAAPTVYEITKPAGSAERFLDDAAREALASAAVAAMPAPNLGRFVPGAVRETAIQYPDPLLAEAARLPKKALAESAARAEAYRRAMEAQNEVVRAASTALSPVGNMAMNQTGATVHDALTRQDSKGGKAAETFDTPIPEELRARYDAWYAQLPENLQYTGDYDLQGAWLERLGQPDKYEAAQNGHLDDYGKKPNHITFSTGSKWHDPKVPERTGGEWRQAKDGSWDFYPGTGNKASDDELKAYFEKYEKGNRVHRREVRQDAEGGDAADSETAVAETPVSEAPAPQGGPRIVINPTTFHNRKDALCVAFNEGFRVWMEANGFEPQSEPTDAQRRFFSDTAYADDEVQLRRTILARIATFDTSVKDPTDDQLSETASFLGAVLESDWCKNEWERDSVSRLMNAVQSAVGAEPVGPRQEPLEAREAEPLQRHAAMGGGETEDDDEERARGAEAGDDPRRQKGYFGDPDADYDPSTDANSDQFDRAKAMEQDRQTFREYLGVDGGEGSAPGIDSMAQEASRTETRQDAEPMADMSWEQIAAVQDGRLRQQRQKTAEAHAELVDTIRTAAEERQQAFADAHKAEGGLARRIEEPTQNAARRPEEPTQNAARRPEEPTTNEVERPAGAIGDIGSRTLAEPRSMNGPSIRPEREIGDMGSRSLTNTKSMNGPSIRPARAIGDIGSRSLTDTKSMNGPSIRPERAIGDMGSRTLTDTKSMNGPSIEPEREIGDIGSRSLTDMGSMNGPSIEPTRAIGNMGSTSLTDTKSMNGPSLTPRRRIGDMGERTLSLIRPRARRRLH